MRGLERALPASRLPDLLRRPLPGPGERDVAIARGRALRGPHLDEVLDLEATPPQQAEPVAVRQVKLDARMVWPLEAVHPEGRPQQPVYRGDVVLFRQAEREERGVGEKD